MERLRPALSTNAEEPLIPHVDTHTPFCFCLRLRRADEAVAERAKAETAKAEEHSARAQPYVFKASTNAEEEFTDFRTFANWYTEMSSVRGVDLLGQVDDNDDDEDDGPTTVSGKILCVPTRSVHGVVGPL
jgi:hypothetical protein